MKIIRSLKESNKNFRNAVSLKSILRSDVSKLNFNVNAQAISKYILNSKASRVNLASDVVIKINSEIGNNNLKYRKNKREFRHSIMNRHYS